ncbi:MAG: hypothetical protein M3R47_16535 [Chloroflexota bacterium]|nr:hypothetical protein [Chloroflexota bacterium]
MIYLVWLLRIVHILAGIFWVGGALTMAFFVAPAVGATAEAGQKFVGHLMGNLKFSSRISAAAGLTILAGFILYWIDSDGLTSPWMNSGAGIGFGIGAAFALVGLVFGILVGRTTKDMAQLGGQFQGKPSPEQMLQMGTLRKKQVTYSSINVLLLILSVIFMAIARYLVF